MRISSFDFLAEIEEKSKSWVAVEQQGFLQVFYMAVLSKCPPRYFPSTQSSSPDFSATVEITVNLEEHPPTPVRVYQPS